MSKLSYLQSGLFSARREKGEWMKFKEVPLAECDKGKYVVAAAGDSEVRIMGLLWIGGETLSASFMIKEHNELHHENLLGILADMGKDCPAQALILGGGIILAEHETRIIRAVSQSGSFGYVPSSMIQEGFKVPGYTVDIEVFREGAGPEFRKSAAALEWFAKNGIKVEY